MHIKYFKLPLKKNKLSTEVDLMGKDTFLRHQ